MLTKKSPFSYPSLQIYSITIMFYSIVYMLLMILPFYALTIGASKTEIGLIIGITMFASMIFRPIAGRIIDQYGSTKVFIIALMVFAISLLGYFFPSIWTFLVVRMVQGVVAAFFSTAMEIVTIDLVSKKMRAQGLSLYSLATILPTTFGPALALWLKDLVSITVILILFFVMGIVNCILALFLSQKIPTHTTNKIKPKIDLHNFRNQGYLLSSGIMLLASIANGSIFTFLPLYLEQQGSSFAEIYFLLQTLTLVITRFLGRNWIPSNGKVPYKILLITLSFASMGSILLGINSSLFFLIFSAILNGIAFSMLYPALLTYISFNIPEESRGFLLGLFIGSADLGFSLGAFAMGPLIDQFSFPIIFKVSSLFCLIALLSVYGYRSNNKEVV